MLTFDVSEDIRPEEWHN